MLNLNEALIEVTSQLIDTTHEQEVNEGPVHTPVYYVQLTFPNGRRFAHSFSSRDESKVQRVADRVAANRNKIQLSHFWTETAPMYGSEAYVKGGSDAAYGLWDADERANGAHIKAAIIAGCNPSPYGQDLL